MFSSYRRWRHRAIARNPATRLYYDLLQRTLTNWVYGAAQEAAFDPQQRTEGRDWPQMGHTMIGLHRLEHIAPLVGHRLDPVTSESLAPRAAREPESPAPPSALPLPRTDHDHCGGAGSAAGSTQFPRDPR